MDEDEKTVVMSATDTSANACESPTPAQRSSSIGNELINDLEISSSNLIEINNINANESFGDTNIHENDNENGNTNENGSNACHFAGHHYHYIEYPHSHSHAAMLPQSSTGSNTYHYCVCSCSSGGGAIDRMQISSDPLKSSSQEQQQQQHHHQQQQQQELQQHQHQQKEDSRLAVAAIVHHQQQSLDVDCGQSLLSHSYQMLNIPPTSNDKKSIVSTSSCHSKLHINDCDLEGCEGCENSATCSCMASSGLQGQQQGEQDQQEHHLSDKKCKKLNNTLAADSMLAKADEITVSESDNNGSLTKRKNMRNARVQKKINSWYAKNYNCNHIEIYSDGDDLDDINHRNDVHTPHDSLTNILDQRPPLPPRPQPIAVQQNENNNSIAHRPGSQSIKKYVIWCLVCGGFSCLLGALFLGVYFLLHSYTITVGNFETVPTFVPATLLILTGLCIMSLARRRNRYSYLIKLSGACGLTSALTCALVTVTTTVLHMSRLQALRECEYAQKTRTCTCYSDMIESQVDRVDKEGVRLVFDSLSDCGVVHGSLYSCLRAIFGLSVAGVLVAVFSCMLVYQLLSHERKKMYWEQLELRCRSLYTSHQQHQQHSAQGTSAHSMAALASIGGGRNAPICRCCEQCHAHRQLQLQTASYPWVDDTGEPRFWAGQPPGNFYSPNPGGDEINSHAPSATSNNRSRRGSSGWSWPRMPWQRTTAESGGNRFRQIPSSPDSQYGFSSANPSLGLAVGNVAVATAAEDDATAAAVAAVAAATATQRAAQAYNLVTGAGGAALPYGIWGPPPPYSDPNSPARRGYYQYMQPSNNLCTSSRIADNSVGVGVGVGVNVGVSVGTSVDAGPLQQRPLSAGALNALNAGSTPNVGSCVVAQHATFDQNSFGQRLPNAADPMLSAYKSKDNIVNATMNNGYTAGGNTGSDSDVESVPNRSFGDRFSNTLPTRKIKKRIVDGSSSIAKCVGSGSGSVSRHQIVSSHRINVQRVFPNSSNSTSENDADANTHQMRSLNSHNHNHHSQGGHNIRCPKLSIGSSNGSSGGGGNNKDNRSSSYSMDIGNNNRVIQRCSEVVLESNACANKNDGNNSMSNGVAIPVLTTTSSCNAPYEDPTESEIYFADVSSCCNMSMKNENGYEDSRGNNINHSSNIHQSGGQQRSSSKHSQTHFQHHQHHHQHQHQHQRSNCSQSSNPSSNPSSISAAAGYRSNTEDDRHSYGQQCENSMHIRQQQNGHSQCRQGDNVYNKKSNTIIINGGGGGGGGDIIGTQKVDKKNESSASIPKDNSLHSMCSIDSEAKTECTDLSPMTPCSNKNPTETIFQTGSCLGVGVGANDNGNSNNITHVQQTPNTSGFSNFIASFPYSSESKFHEAHRRFTKQMHDNIITTTTTTTKPSTNEPVQEGHYEIINDNNGSGIRLSSTGMQHQHQKHQHHHQHQHPHQQHQSKQHQQRPKNLSTHCTYDRSSMNRITQQQPHGGGVGGRSSKAKENFDSVWSQSDAGGSCHNRQRL